MKKQSIVDIWKQKAKNLKTETLALYLACRHPRTPWYAKALTGVVVAYAFSPIDLIPDFIPILGYLDDLVLIPLGVALVMKMIPGDVMEDCREQARMEMGGEKPVNKIAAGVIILIWVVLIVFVIYRVTIRFRK